MPLANLSQCLATLPSDAAVGCFSVYNLESLLAVVAAAEAEGKPAVVSLDESNLGDGKLGQLAQAALFAARKADVPLAVHLNHGRSLAGIREALELGLRSVMFDGSDLDQEENVRLTREARELAHEVGAEIEGEYGPLCTDAGEVPRVLDFLERTRIDFLAFSVPKTFTVAEQAAGVELLAEIAVNTAIPFVLHGASRLSETILHQALRNGVRKVNVHTEILRALARGMRQGMAHDAENPLSWLEAARFEVQDFVQRRIRLYSAA